MLEINGGSGLRHWWQTALDASELPMYFRQLIRLKAAALTI